MFVYHAPSLSEYGYGGGKQSDGLDCTVYVESRMEEVHKKKCTCRIIPAMEGPLQVRRFSRASTSSTCRGTQPPFPASTCVSTYPCLQHDLHVLSRTTNSVANPEISLTCKKDNLELSPLRLMHGHHLGMGREGKGKRRGTGQPRNR